MNTAYIRFYEELNDLLPDEKKKVRIVYTYWGTPSVKDVIEANGVPHTEVDLILVNGVSVDFNYRIKNNDDISVYPVFESFDISSLQHLRPDPLRNPFFVLDVHLGTLARYLRMTGLDSLYKNNYNSDDIVNISILQKRTILTKDLNILKRKDVSHGYLVRGNHPSEQLKEVISRFQLGNKLLPFTRCMECNHLLENIDKEEVQNEIPEKVRGWHNEFKKCPGCGRIYWKGSHYLKMLDLIDELL